MINKLSYVKKNEMTLSSHSNSITPLLKYLNDDKFKVKDLRTLIHSIGI